jgi:serine/threonine protein kinase/dipeptidyl aminopeptidase/acylaminoacyl peptidase
MAGQRLGHFEILEKLGAGGMGEVYKARDSRLDRIVAIKVLPPGFASDSVAVRRLQREARLIASLSHPHICPLFEVGHENGTDFLVMEYLEGETLAERLKRGKLPLALALRHGVQIASAVAAAHTAGIIHRDLKPGNVMLTKTGARLLDFGLAKQRDVISLDDEGRTGTLRTQTTEGTISGTIGYMSPEQAEGKPVDTRSDIFSFGTVLYEMASGQRAFHGDSSLATLAAILEKDPAPLAGDLPAGLRKIVSRCLRKSPDERYQHISDVRIALEEIEEDTRSRPSTVTMSMHRTRIGWLAGTAVALILAALALGLWVFRDVAGTEPSSLEAVPLTSEAGFEESPSFSPDGTHVAYSWNGENQDNFDIYVKLIGAPKPLRLTTDPADDRNPVFSPDGRTIGFIRVSNQGRRFVVTPPIGGSERVVAELPQAIHDRAHGALATGPSAPSEWNWSFAWLRDGRSVILDGLRALSLETGEVRDLMDGSGQPLTGWYPAVAPNGRSVAFVRPAGIVTSDLFVVDVADDGTPSGEARRVAPIDGDAWGLTWTADGRHVVLSSGKPSGSSGVGKALWRIPAVSGAKPERLPLGEDLTSPAIPRAGSRLAFVHNTWDANIWRATLPGAGAPPPLPARFVSSTRNDGNPQYSTDGRRLAFASDRTGHSAIWVSDADGSNVVEVFSRAEKHSGTPRWSPDGQRLAFDSTAEGDFDIYVIRPGSRQPLRLTTEPGDDAMPSWAPDGKWIYFASSRTGRQEVWKVAPTGGPATQVTRNGGACAFPSADGARLYYTKHDGDAVLWSMPVAGGQETEVLPSVVMRNFVVFEDGIYFIPRPAPDGQLAVHHLAFSTGAVTTVLPVTGPLSYGLTVSPDRRQIAFTQTDGAGRDLMLVDPFR